MNRTKLKRLTLSGFKSFAQKTELVFSSSITAIVGPNGSGKSNVAEAFRWVLGEQSLKSLRGKRGEDLIFNGGAGGRSANRAEVAVTFDNQSRHWPLAFDEVTLSRVVYRDGANDYCLNGSKVLLRDLTELLAKVSLGPSGHHIISQGEADRLLTASPSERRELIEEALGLRLYRDKILESERKLEKTEENIKQAEALRREIAPHLKFLKRQAEKAEKARIWREELEKLYREFLPQAWCQVLALEKKLSAEDNRMARLTLAREKLAAEKKKVAGEETRKIGLELEQRRIEEGGLERELGRLEGKREAGQAPSLETFGSRLERELEQVLAAKTWEAAKGLVREIKNSWRLWWSGEGVREANVQQLETLTAKLQQVKEEIKSLTVKLTDAQVGEKKILALENEIKLLESQTLTLASEKARLKEEKEEIQREAVEGATLTDREILNYVEAAEKLRPLAEKEWKKLAGSRRKEIEKIKIRLEDQGVESGEIFKEFESVNARDKFLERELADLAKAAAACAKVRIELEEKLIADFKQGLEKINVALARFIVLLFGGGSAELSVIRPSKNKEKNKEDWEEKTEEVEEKEGLEIKVVLPKKHIRGLAMLSGGERALVSITLLFALSQVNPPPFLILDETDAALDEANSRKYGDMVEELAKHSQLILITHNRETMSRAGILYGVTIDLKGVSRLLSLKFDEASSYAK